MITFRERSKRKESIYAVGLVRGQYVTRDRGGGVGLGMEGGKHGKSCE
jgi:hypothetical protein